MKRIVIITAILLCFGTTWAQFPNWNEWFRQKKTQRKYLVNQIAALKVYLGYLKEGYDIAQKGLTTIGDIKNGTFNLDKDYFNSLNQVKPVIRNSPKINDILIYQQWIIRDMRKLLDNARLDENFNSEEIAYIEEVYQNMLSECNDSVDELTLITTAGEAEMKDDERLLRLDKVHEDMLDMFAFAQDFIATTHQLSLQRKQELDQLNERKLLYLEI